MTQFPFILFFICTIAVSTSCSKTSSVSTEVIEEETECVVVVVSGLDSDPSPEQIAGTATRGIGNSGMFQLMADLEKSGLECKFFNWNGTVAGQIHEKQPPGAEEIVDWIQERAAEKQKTEFIFLGHSWGGHTVIEAASLLIKNKAVHVPFAVMLDPSSAMRGFRPGKLPGNMDALVVYHTGNLFCWGPWKGESRVKNVNLGDSENGFMENGFPNYGSSFDIKAHNAAEWDPKIHANIHQRILDAVNVLRSK